MKDKRSHRKPAQCSFHSSSWDHIIGSIGSDGENEQYVVKDIVKFNSINLETNSVIADCPFLCRKSEKLVKRCMVIEDTFLPIVAEMEESIKIAQHVLIPSCFSTQMETV